MSDNKKGQNFFHGAAIYTIGIIVVKILGAVYKIPLGNILGDDGFNHFDVTYKVYNVFLTISTSGFPVAMSRLISEANALDRKRQVSRVFHVGLGMFLTLGALSTLAMLLFPSALASWMGDIQATQCIFIMAPSVVLVCVAAAYRGYAQGYADMIPTTVSQVIETAVKVLVGLSCAAILHAMGKGVALCAAGAIFGTTVSSLAAMLYMQIKVHRKYKTNPTPAECSDVPDSRQRIFWDLLRIGIPIAISTSVMSIIQLADSKITLTQLQNAAGYSENAAYVLNGVYAKAMTVYNVPYAFVVPFLSTIVPTISAARVKGDLNSACKIAEDAMRLCALICLPMAIGMAVLAKPCMDVLYPGSAEQGALLLCELGVTCCFMTMTLITDSVLPAFGHERLPLISISLGAIVKVIVTYVLVGNPAINVYGAPIGTCCCYIVMLTSNLLLMARTMTRPVRLGRVFARSGLSCAVMGVAAWAVWSLLRGVIGGTLIPFGIAVMAGVAVYFVMIIATRAVTLEDMKLIPKGEKIARILHIR